MNTISLDDIRKAADEEYGHLEIPFGDGDSVVLCNILQLDKERRAEFQAAAKGSDDEDAEEVDQIETFGNALKVVAEDKEAADRLLSAIGDNLAVLVTLFKKYTNGTQVGEA